jgi:hypothetical protein
MVILSAHHRRVRRYVIAAWLAACSEAPPPSPMPDAGAQTDAGHSVTIEDPAPPAPPVPPSFVCPPGWRERDAGDGARACEPWAEDRAPDCASDELAIPGIGCERIDECPADGWPAELPGTAVIYVRAGALDGDGTRELPFGTLAEGLDAAGDRDVIVALAAGDYAGGSTLTMQNSALVGACASGTTITNESDAETSAALRVLAEEAQIRNLTFQGGGRVLHIAERAGVVARDARFVATTLTAIRLDDGARFTGVRVKLIGADTPPAGGAPVIGVRRRTRVSLERSTVVGGTTSVRHHILASDAPGAEVEVSIADTALIDATHAISGELTLTLDRVAIERMRVGLELAEGSVATVRDLRAREISGVGQVSPMVALQADISVDRAWISDGSGGGVYAFQEGSRITMRDVVLFDYEARGAFRADQGAELELERAVIRRVRGVVAEANASALTLRDVDIAGVTRTEPRDGDAVRGSFGSRVVLERVAGRDIERGFAIAAASAELVGSDLDVADAVGVLAQCAPDIQLPCDDGPTRLELTRVRLRDMRRFGVALESSEATLRDIDVERVAGEGDIRIGAGVYVVGVADAERVRVRGATVFGIASLIDGSLLTMRDVRIEGTVAAPCVSEDCSARLGGDGALCATDGVLAMESFVVLGCERAGVAVYDDCNELRLARGDVTENAIGALSDASAREPLWSAVRVRNNDVDYQRIELTLPPIDIRL